MEFISGKVDGTRHVLLFQERHRPLYNPQAFGQADQHFQPIFDPWSLPLGNASFILTKAQVRIACQGVISCEYDYLLTGRREFALETLAIEKKNEEVKREGEKRRNFLLFFVQKFLIFSIFFLFCANFCIVLKNFLTIKNFSEKLRSIAKKRRGNQTPTG